jgi:hypothetical protein
VDAIRARVRIAEVLRSAGVACPEDGRIACPVCRARSRTSFSFTRDKFHCFRCNAGGDVIELAKCLLGVGFIEAAAHCARLGGLGRSPAPARSSIQRALAEREEADKVRTAEENAWHFRWRIAIDEFREVEARRHLLESLLCDDPSESKAGTARLLDELANSYLDEQIAIAKLDAIEAELRRLRGGSRR